MTGMGDSEPEAKSMTDDFKINVRDEERTVEADRVIAFENWMKMEEE